MASTTILFVSPDRVKRETPLGGSVDDNLLQPCIFSAQQRWVYPTLGTALYDKVAKLIDDNQLDDAGNEIYKTLLQDYVIPCLVQYAFATAIPVLRVRFVNNAVVAMNSEQGSAVSADDIKPIVAQAEDIGNWFRERLVDWLISRTDIPELNSNSFPNLSPSRTNYTQGLNVEYTADNQDLQALRQLLGITG